MILCTPITPPPFTVDLASYPIDGFDQRIGSSPNAEVVRNIWHVLSFDPNAIMSRYALDCTGGELVSAEFFNP